jgi:hypothetical protein
MMTYDCTFRKVNESCTRFSSLAVRFIMTEVFNVFIKDILITEGRIQLVTLLEQHTKEYQFYNKKDVLINHVLFSLTHVYLM